MRYLLFILAISSLALTPVAFAQGSEEEHIVTDRDSFTPSVRTVGRGRLVLEAAYSFIDNKDVPESHSFPELLARYGMTDWLELRVGANYEVGGGSSSISGGFGGLGDLESGEIESESKISYGMKISLNDQHDWLPRTAAILQASTPTSGPETRTHVVATYAWGWTIAERWEWDTAIRYGEGSEEEDDFNRWAPSTVLKFELAEQWNTHIEYFGIFTNGRAEELSQSYLSPGIHYLINSNCEVGVRVGWGLGGDAANFFSNVGIGVRF